jgi:hypothetical protein
MIGNPFSAGNIPDGFRQSIATRSKYRIKAPAHLLVMGVRVGNDDDAFAVKELLVFLEARLAEVTDRSTGRVIDVLTGWRHTTCEDCWYSCSQATVAAGVSVDLACCDDDRSGQPCDCGLEFRRRQVLVALAQSFAFHPGYRVEWEVRPRG